MSYLNTDIGPKIMKINPENGTILSISAEYANVQVFLNKKGYCKASIKDLLFDEMEFDSACVSDPDNRCDFILPLNNDYNDYFFKCAQMINPKTKNYYLKVEEADSLSVLNISIENIIKLNDPNTAIIPDYLLEQNGTIIGSMGELDLILQPIINFFNECSFSTTTSNFDEMNDKMNCANLTRNNILNNKFHCEGLFAANEEPYTIACKSNKNITIANRISKPYVLLKQ